MRVVLIASAPPPAIGLSDGLVAMGHEVAAVVAIRAPEGRYGQGYPFALHSAAPDGDLLFVRSGERLGDLLRAYTPDVALCASFPSRIPDDALAAPRHGILNSHPALLPRYRGPNPIGWALRNGDAQIGLTLHRMTSEFDAGPIYAQGAVPLAADAGDPQDEAQTSYAGLFEPEYIDVDWTKDAREIHNQTRAWPFAPPVGGLRGPLIELGGERVRLLRTRLDGDAGGLRIECGDGPLWVLETEPAT